MEKSIAAGTYTVQRQAELLATFPITKFSVSSVRKPLEPGRTSQSGKTATAHYAPTILTTDDDREVMIDGVQLAEQAVANPELAKAIFKTVPVGAIVGDKLTITKQGEFKAEFNLGYVNRKFITGAVA